MTRKLSSSGAAVLRWFLSGNSSWSEKDGAAVYESRALTGMICRRLARDGYLAESFTDDGSVFTLNQPESNKAKELVRSL